MPGIVVRRATIPDLPRRDERHRKSSKVLSMLCAHRCVSLTRKACCRYATKDAKSVRDAQIGEIVKSIEQHLQRASVTHWGRVRNVGWAGIQQRRPTVTPLPPTVSRLSRTASENAAADTTYSDEASLEKLERDLQVVVASTQLTDAPWPHCGTSPSMAHASRRTASRSASVLSPSIAEACSLSIWSTLATRWDLVSVSGF